jgi:competence ComEA-like helix-hairpin-helix protein
MKNSLPTKWTKKTKIRFGGSIMLLATATVVLAACSSRRSYDLSASPADANGININTATVDEFEELPGIGRKTAEAIVEYRTANGAFRRVEHLMLIRGVSETRFAELRPHVKTE